MHHHGHCLQIPSIVLPIVLDCCRSKSSFGCDAVLQVVGVFGSAAAPWVDYNRHEMVPFQRRWVAVACR